MRSRLLRTLCAVSYALRVPQILGPFGRDRFVVLMYHGIVDEDFQGPVKNRGGYNISRKQFAHQMHYLSRTCHVVSADDAITGQNLSASKKNVVITFDDGYRNNYTNAFPILRDLGLPALFSIPTQFVFDRMPLWNDRIEHAIMQTTKRDIVLENDKSVQHFNLDTPAQKGDCLRFLITRCLSMPQSERDAFILSATEKLDVDAKSDEILENPDYAPLTLHDMKEMLNSGLVRFASHSVHHYALSLLDKTTLRKELTQSRTALATHLGMPCTVLCLPGGFYSDEVASAIDDCGFTTVFSSEEKENDIPLVSKLVGRYCIRRDTNMSHFADLVHGPVHRLFSRGQS